MCFGFGDGDIQKPTGIYSWYLGEQIFNMPLAESKLTSLSHKWNSHVPGMSESRSAWIPDWILGFTGSLLSSSSSPFLLLHHPVLLSPSQSSADGSPSLGGKNVHLHSHGPNSPVQQLLWREELLYPGTWTSIPVKDGDWLCSGQSPWMGCSNTTDQGHLHVCDQVEKWFLGTVKHRTT